MLSFPVLWSCFTVKRWHFLNLPDLYLLLKLIFTHFVVFIHITDDYVSNISLCYYFVLSTNSHPYNTDIQVFGQTYCDICFVTQLYLWSAFQEISRYPTCFFFFFSLNKKQRSAIKEQKLTGSQCNLPFCYYLLLVLCIVHLPPLITHQWLQYLHSRLAAGSLALRFKESWTEVSMNDRSQFGGKDVNCNSCYL